MGLTMSNQILQEFNRIVEIIQHAKMTQHLDVAEKMTDAFIRKWSLRSEKVSNPICDAIYEEINSIRNEMITEDIKNANHATN